MTVIQKFIAAYQAFRAIPASTETNEEGFNIRNLLPQEVAEAKTIFPLEKFQIFGFARSGTTLLVRLIRLHPLVHCNYQAHFFTRPPFLKALVSDPGVRDWLSVNGNRWNRGDDMSPVILRAVADFVLERDARREGKIIVGDKSPNNVINGLAVHNMYKIYPDSKLIFIVRDGRDAALSRRVQAFIDLPYQLSREDLRIRSDFSQDPRPYLNGSKSIFTEKGLMFEATTWEKNVRETDDAGKNLYRDQYFSLRYEDLIKRPWEEMSRLWEFLGATSNIDGLPEKLAGELSLNPDAEYQQQKAGDIVDPLTKGKRGSWKDLFTERDRQIFLEIAGELLAQWGYE